MFNFSLTAQHCRWCNPPSFERAARNAVVLVDLGTMPSPRQIVANTRHAPRWLSGFLRSLMKT